MELLIVKESEEWCTNSDKDQYWKIMTWYTVMILLIYMYINKWFKKRLEICWWNIPNFIDDIDRVRTSGKKGPT